MGPAIEVAEARVTSWSVVPSAPEALPMVKPPSVAPKLQPEVEKVPVKSLATGSMRSVPGPLMAPVKVLGALWLITSAPPAISVLPL